MLTIAGGIILAYLAIRFWPVALVGGAAVVAIGVTLLVLVFGGTWLLTASEIDKMSGWDWLWFAALVTIAVAVGRRRLAAMRHPAEPHAD